MATREELRDKFLTCIICTDVFKEPVTLHCGHSFCIPCVTSYTKTQQQAVAENVLPCAHCRRMTKVPDPTKPVDDWASQLKTGFFVKNLVDAILPKDQENEHPSTASSTDDDKITALVFDIGSSTCRVGFSGEEGPRVTFPSVVRHHHNTEVHTVDVGYDALSREESVYPVEHGIVTNWDDMEKILHFAFQEINMKPEEHPILLATSPLNSDKEHEQMTEIMFEKFNVPAMYIQQQGSLSLFASGRTTGIVLGSGAATTWAVPVVHGASVKPAIETQKRGGNEITDYLQTALTDRGYAFSSYDAKEAVQNMKEKVAYVSLDANFEKYIYDQTPALSRSYANPDGQIFDIGEEIFMCTETMFQPFLLGIQSEGIHELIHKSIMGCDESVHDELYSNIVLAGGNTMFPGIVERLEKEIKSLAPNTTIGIIVPSDDRKQSAFVGGSLLSSLDLFQPKWITRQQYNETGVSIAHQMYIP